MEFIKRNYEKVILSLVLLGLVGVLAFMPVLIFYDQQKMAALRTEYIPRKVEALPPQDLSRQQAVLDRLKSPGKLDFSTTNKLFNPVQWRRQKDGMVIKGENLGPQAAVVTKITPLYFIITLDSVTTAQISTNETSVHYALSVEDQSAAIPGQRRKRPHIVSMGKGNDTVSDKTVTGKNEGFTLVAVKGPPENPDQLVLKLADTGATNTLSKSQPFRRVDAYSADLKYAPENYSRAGQRVGDHLTFAGDDYNIIAIEKNEVKLLAQSNQKKYTLPYAP
jgi:hypothetical protein